MRDRGNSDISRQAASSSVEREAHDSMTSTSRRGSDRSIRTQAIKMTKRDDGYGRARTGDVVTSESVRAIGQLEPLE